MQTVNDGSRWMLRLDDGQDLFAALTEFARGQNVRAGVIVSGIGMVRSGAIGYWNGKEYEPKDIRDPHELVGLHGSIAHQDGQPSIHLHVALADSGHRLLGGHLLRATLGILGEIYIEVFPARSFGRPLNESLGLRTLDLAPGPET
ncbi:MAG: PPC domain-containing DNA-binding protein [Thermoplasmata archaeon]